MTEGVTRDRKDNIMGLLNDVKKTAAPAEPVDTTNAPVAEGKKKHNNSEYQKKARARALAAATLIDKTLTAEQKAAKGEGEFATVQDALNVLLKVRDRSSVAGQVSIFEKMFGPDAKVGDKVNAYDMLKRTNKNFSQIAKAIKEWEAKGTVVTFDEAKLEYTITKLA